MCFTGRSTLKPFELTSLLRNELCERSRKLTGHPRCLSVPFWAPYTSSWCWDGRRGPASSTGEFRGAAFRLRLVRKENSSQEERRGQSESPFDVGLVARHPRGFGPGNGEGGEGTVFRAVIVEVVANERPVPMLQLLEKTVDEGQQKNSLSELSKRPNMPTRKICMWKNVKICAYFSCGYQFLSRSTCRRVRT